MSGNMIWQLILIQMATFVALLAVLRKIMYSTSASEAARLQKLGEENSRREKDLARMREDTEEECQLRLRKAEDRMRELKNRAKAEATELRQEIMDKARTEAESVVQRAIGAREKIREEAERLVAIKSIEVALELIRSALDAEELAALHEESVNRMTRELGGIDAKVFPENISQAVVTTAREFSPEALAEIEAVLLEKCGRKIPVKCKLSLEVIAGATLEAGGVLIDGSLEARLLKAAELITSV